MGKRKNHAKRSLGALPKGIPHKKHTNSKKGLAAPAATVNPFEVAGRHGKSPKHQVHNRHISNQQTKFKALSASAMAAGVKNGYGRRSQQLLLQSLQRAKKANVFVDRRIGEYDQNVTTDEQNLARLVKERTRRSKKSTKFNLNDDNYNDKGMLEQLTHRGQVIDDKVAANSVLLSDDEDDDGGNLDAMDTALHFGGGTSQKQASIYGTSGADASMADNYSQRKTELDDMILRRKTMKAEKMKAREQQEEVIADLDGAFKELSSMLNFRDKEQEIKTHIKAKREGKLDKDTQEMEDWDKEIREFSAGKKAKATDRTKTPEEVAKEEAERLHKLETRRMARMNGDFGDDDFSDLSDGEENNRSKKRRKQDKKLSNPDEIHSSDDEGQDGEEELKAKFTADGLVYVNKRGEVVKKVDDGDDDDDSNENKRDEDDNDDSSQDSDKPDNHDVLVVGSRVEGNYRAREQFQDKDHWYVGTISKVNKDKDGNVTYNVDYDDGDFEEDMDADYVRPLPKTEEEAEAEEDKVEEAVLLKRKRQKARDKARYVESDEHILW